MQRGGPKFLGAQDLANQIRWSKDYKAELTRHGVKPGKYLAPEVGEYFSGRYRVACFFQG